MRSWLLVPATDMARLTAGWASETDVLVVDLTAADAGSKAQARQQAQEFLDARQSSGKSCFVLAHPHESGLLEKDVETALRGKADGILLAGVRAPADIQRLHVMIDAREAMMDIPAGTTRIAAICGDNATGVLNCGEHMAKASPRLAALGWSVAALSADMGASRTSSILQSARSALLLAAATSGIAAIDSDCDRPADANFASMCWEAREDGFSGKFTHRIEHLSMINTVFSPDGMAIEQAKAILALFDASDTAACLTPEGRLLRPSDLVRARRILACAGKNAGG